MGNDVTRVNRRLRPKQTVQKVLISTTSRMTGEYGNSAILITHALPQLESRSMSMRLAETHMSRSAYVIAFETPPIEKGIGVVLPNYSPTGVILAAYLSVLFGKRFDSHGLLEGSGFYHIPDIGSYDAPSNPQMPFNSHDKRQCLGVPLEINQFSMIEGVFPGPPPDTKDVSRLNAVCRFYMQALQNAEHNTEVAYLHLITAGEILSGGFRYSDTKGVKQKFVKALCSLLGDDFYVMSDSALPFRKFDPSNVESSVGAAYDLRSCYVHSGAPFGTWVEPVMGSASGDLQIGKPLVEDKDLGQALAVAPTFLGLERLVRYCVLTFMASRGLLLPGSTGWSGASAGD